MDPVQLSSSPFSALTFVAAPALLTNASSLLVLSTINRMLRTRERMHDMFAKMQAGSLGAADSQQLVEEVNRVEEQASLLLRALHAIYVALAAFACGTLVTLLGSGLATFAGPIWAHAFAAVGVALGIVGVGGLVLGCVRLFRATRISLVNIRIEAARVRELHALRHPATDRPAAP